VTGSPGGGWDRWQNEGSDAGPDWFAPAEPSEAPPAWVPSDEPSEAPSTWASFAKPEKVEKAPRRASGGSSFGKKPSGSGAGASSRSGSGSGFGGRKRASSSSSSPSDEPEHEKKPLSREKLEQRAKNICLYHLGRQMRTRSQLAERLKRKEIPDDIAEAVLDRFEELQLLDDSRYAETFVRSRHQESGLAKRALSYELRKRGIDGEVAQEALDTLDEDQELATARRLVDSRLRSTGNLETQVRVRRLVGMLARKGYPASVALRVVREALQEEGERLDAQLTDAMDDAGSDGFA
jgi:regulatory protein